MKILLAHGGRPGCFLHGGCNTLRGSQNILSSVQSAGLSHVVPILASTDDPWSIDRMLEKTRTVVCSEHAVAQMRGQLPPDVELILADRTLDRGGIELLRDGRFALIRIDDDGPGIPEDQIKAMLEPEPDRRPSAAQARHANAARRGWHPWTLAALDALTRRKMQGELLQLWADTRFTMLFVTALALVRVSRSPALH